MDVYSCFETVARTEIEKNPKLQDDYVGKDGILMCGKCHTPKRKYTEILGKKILVSVMCECQEKKEKEKIEKQKEIERKVRYNELKKDSLIDDKFSKCSFETSFVTSDNEKQIKICKRYAEKFNEMYERNQGLLIYGSVGTGKSHVAACIANEVMKKLDSVYVTSFVKILGENTKNELEDIINRMSRAKLVIFDDLGAERSTDYALEIVYNIVDSRYRQKKPMIVTTNMTLEQMKNESDIRLSRIYDRIFEVCYPIGFFGTSIRKKEAAARYKEVKDILEG